MVRTGISVRLPTDLDRALDREARKTRKTRTEVIEEALRAYLHPGAVTPLIAAAGMLEKLARDFQLGAGSLNRTVTSLRTHPTYKEEQALKLSHFERWSLRNQYLILERIDPDNAAEHAERREALEQGLESAYEGRTMPAVYPDSEVVTEEECKEVIDILVMFQALGRAAKLLPEKERGPLEFDGFDGNDETGQWAYCKWVMETEGRFKDVRCKEDDLNSHYPVIDKYRRMFEVWEGMGKPHEMDAKQARAVAAAAIHPDHRAKT